MLVDLGCDALSAAAESQPDPGPFSLSAAAESLRDQASNLSAAVAGFKTA